MSLSSVYFFIKQMIVYMYLAIIKQTYNLISTTNLQSTLTWNSKMTYIVYCTDNRSGTLCTVVCNHQARFLTLADVTALFSRFALLQKNDPAELQCFLLAVHGWLIFSVFYRWL